MLTADVIKKPDFERDKIIRFDIIGKGNGMMNVFWDKEAMSLLVESEWALVKNLFLNFSKCYQ